MNLTFKKVTQQDIDLEKIHQLYEESFPEDEKAPFQQLINNIQLSTVQFLSFYNENQLCGFTYLIVENHTVYIFYLVIALELRNQGYGSEIVKIIQNLYNEHTLFLDIELVSKEAFNYLERKRRKSFYLKNGFVSSSCTYHFHNVDYEVLQYGTSGNIHDLYQLFMNYSNGKVNVQFKKTEV